MNYVEFGKGLKTARVLLQLSKRYVARELDIDEDTVSQIESGKRAVSISELCILSQIYGTSVKELINMGKKESIEDRDILNVMQFKQTIKNKYTPLA